MAFLIGMSGAIKGKKFDLNRDRTTIGRAVNNDIIIPDESVSSQHCYISRRADRFVLHDLNSTNGTTLNLQPVKTEAPLQSKQVLQIGSAELLFESESESDVTVSMSPMTDVLVDNAPSVTVPKSFSSVSPFGARNKSRKGLWLTLVLVFGIIALVGIVYFFVVLMHLK